MFNSKSTLLAQALLFFASYASCQGDAAPNGTLYIPGIAQLAGVLGTPAAGAAIVASQVTVEGASTVFAIVDALPTAVQSDPLTATLVISPTGARLSANAIGNIASDVAINCSIAGGTSTCQLEAEAADIAFTSSFTEATSGIPVVALGFASASASASGSSSGSSASSGSTVVVGVTVTPTSSSSVSALTSGISSTSGPSSSSSSSTAPASSVSTTQPPSAATNVHASMGSVLIGLVIVAFSLSTL